MMRVSPLGSFHFSYGITMGLDPGATFSINWVCATCARRLQESSRKKSAGRNFRCFIRGLLDSLEFDWKEAERTRYFGFLSFSGLYNSVCRVRAYNSRREATVDS